MKLKSFIISLLGLWGVVALTSCDNREIDIADKGESMVPMSLDMRAMAPSFATRADVADVPAERTVNTYDILVFRSGEEDVFTVHSSSSAPSQTGEDGSFTSGTFLVPTGALDLYVVANGPEAAREAGTRTALLDAVSLFAANSPESFVMTASKSADVSSLTPDGDGVRHVSGVSLERIASKVVLGKVAKAFASPALNSAEVRLLGARLVNVPKSSKVMRPSSGDAVPGAVATAYHNGTAEWENNSLITWSPASSLEVTSSGVETGVSLYGYPNTTTEAAQAADGDRVMKLVLKVSVGGTVYYYPIGIPQTTDASRNLVYRISKVTLRRPGNTDDDPIKYLEQGVVDVAMTVLDWNEATLVSDYVGDLLTEEEVMPNYFYFEALEPGSTVSMTNYGGNLPELKYSSDRKNWTDWDYAAINLNNLGDRIYLKGEGTLSLSYSVYSTFNTTGRLAVGGDISLISDMGNSAFSSLFKNNIAVVDASQLILPFEELEERCYRYMFEGSGLINAPTMAPEKVARWCADQMFASCSSLIDISNVSLPATTLTDYCYQGMFYNCVSLEDASCLNLPATTLPQKCYGSSWIFGNSVSQPFSGSGGSYGMFQNCTSLKKAPSMAPTIVNIGSCADMFSGCSSLIDISGIQLLASRLYSNSYLRMFDNCSSLTYAPIMAPDEVNIASCQRMFRNCTNLVDISDISLPALTLAKACYAGMFENCVSLISAPAMAPNRVSENSCYEMFRGCSSLDDISYLSLPALNLSESCYRGMFCYCYSLTSAPSMAPTDVADNSCFSMFSYCYSLEDISRLSLPDLTLTKACYSSMFLLCASLKIAPPMAPTIVDQYSCANMFDGCFSLTDISDISLPAPSLAIGCYDSMFSSCQSLTETPPMSPSVVANSCCRAMFYNCTSLVDISRISLPATTLASHCYNFMFGSCSSLVSAPAMAPTIVADHCCSGMFADCVRLSDISLISLPAATLAKSCYGAEFSAYYNEEGYRVSCITYYLNDNTAITHSYSSTSRSYMGMFENCSSLTSVPSMAFTAVSEYSCAAMFSGCSSLTDLSGLSLSGTLVKGCYSQMFDKCVSLVVAPTMTITSVAEYSNSRMFHDCNQLSDISGLQLSATSLAGSCYTQMFAGCSSLSLGPVLPAQILVSKCYYMMFSGCSHLSYLKAMFTTTPSSSYTGLWLRNVASTGTFVKNAAATWNVTGANGVPSGWTVETAAN